MYYTPKRDSIFSAVLSIVLFNLTWLGLVLLMSDGIFVAGLLIFITLIILPFTPTQLLVSVLIAGIGICVDTLLMLGSFMDFGAPFLPVWLMMLWGSFALAVHIGLAFLFRFPVVVQSLFGAVGGSSSYYAGMVAGSVAFPQSTVLTVSVFALVWAVLLPLFVYLAVRCRADSPKHS